MQRKIISILFFLLIINSIFAATSIGQYELEIKEEKTTLFDLEDSKISVTITIGNYEIKKSEKGYEISVENFGHRLIPGKPNIPSKIYSIAIPPGAKLIDISYEVSNIVMLPGNYSVPPADLSRVLCEEDPEVFEQELTKYNENYIEVYGSNEPYPASSAEFVSIAGYRKYNLVDVRVMPFTYYPQSGQLEYYPKIIIDLSYTFPEGFNYDKIMIDNIPKAEQLAEEVIFNYNQAKNWYPHDTENRENYDYVIITNNLLTNYITELVEWEENKGRHVYVATTEWIDLNYSGYDLAEKMRNFLRDKFPSSEWGILDVCLIGNHNDVPMRLTAQDVGYGKPKTDYYYAELSKPDDESWDKDVDRLYGEDSDQIDFFAEVNVGRIPWSDAATVVQICQKSVAFEQNDDPAYKKNILLLGAFYWSDTDNAVLMEEKIDQPWMADWTVTRMYEEAQSSYPCDYDLDYLNIKNIWSTGTYAFVNWAGHGTPYDSKEYYPTQTFVDIYTCNYLNDDYPAIICACSCANSDPDSDNIGRNMMKQGAVGFLGSTKVAFGHHNWKEPYDGSSQSLDYFFTTSCTSEQYTQGQAHQWALREMYTNELWQYTKYEMFGWGSLWGNPDLKLGPINAPPETPTKPQGPEIWTKDTESEFESTTTDPDGHKLYYMFDWGDGNKSEWIGPYDSGQPGKASHAWTELGVFQLKVIARDQFGVTSNWSESVNITIILNARPSKPTISGPIIGRPNKALKFNINSTDPEGYDLYYLINWGDGDFVIWDGPYSSGEEVTFSHSWSESGDYTIIVKVRDEYGAESLQNSFSLNIIKSRTIISPILIKLLQRFPNAFTILRFILEL